jgi:hypothetical protein
MRSKEKEQQIPRQKISPTGGFHRDAVHDEKGVV